MRLDSGIILPLHSLMKATISSIKNASTNDECSSRINFSSEVTNSRHASTWPRCWISLFPSMVLGIASATHTSAIYMTPCVEWLNRYANVEIYPSLRSSSSELMTNWLRVATSVVECRWRCLSTVWICLFVNIDFSLRTRFVNRKVCVTNDFLSIMQSVEAGSTLRGGLGIAYADYHHQQTSGGFHGEL